MFDLKELPLLKREKSRSINWENRTEKEEEEEKRRKESRYD